MSQIAHYSIIVTSHCGYLWRMCYHEVRSARHQPVVVVVILTCALKATPLCGPLFNTTTRKKYE